MNNKIDFPHFYKKSKSIKIKTLDDNTEKKEYVFPTSGKAGIQTIVNHSNNLNQIVAWCLLKTYYLGVSKDISTNISKNKLPFNQFKNDLASLKNDFVKKDFEYFFDII